MEPELEGILKLMRGEQESKASTVEAGAMIWPHVAKHFQRFGEWVSAIYPEVDHQLAEEIADGLSKICGLHAGTHLGYLYMTNAKRGCVDSSLRQLDSQLTSGV
jgi:hypothetical protein